MHATRRPRTVDPNLRADRVRGAVGAQPLPNIRVTSLKGHLPESQQPIRAVSRRDQGWRIMSHLSALAEHHGYDRE